MRSGKREVEMTSAPVGFWTPAITKDPRAQLAGVQKAPRHEVAGSWAPVRQRALCGFNVGAALDGKRDASARRRAMSAYRGTEVAPPCKIGRERRSGHRVSGMIGGLGRE